MTKARDEQDDLRVVTTVWTDPGTFSFQMDPTSWWTIIVTIQLALRNPMWEGPSSVLARTICEWMIAQLCERHPDAREILEAGFDPSQDHVTVPEEQIIVIGAAPADLLNFWANLVRDDGDDEGDDDDWETDYLSDDLDD